MHHAFHRKEFPMNLWLLTYKPTRLEYIIIYLPFQEMLLNYAYVWLPIFSRAPGYKNKVIDGMLLQRVVNEVI